MKSIKSLGNVPISSSILADDILEFHAARLLLLFQICGAKGKIDGLTKMAKLDFFVRYPSFFNSVCRKLGVEVKSQKEAIESRMVRYHYGPWDHRYYQVLAFLKGGGLIKFQREGKKVVILLTEPGSAKARLLEESESFQRLVAQMHAVRQVLSKKSGTQLKNLVYQTFDQEIAQLDLGEEI